MDPSRQYRFQASGADTVTDEPQRNSLEQRPAQEKRYRERLLAVEAPFHELLLHHGLNGLNHAGGSLPFFLSRGQRRQWGTAVFERFDEGIGGGDGVLNGVVDAGTPDRGHVVGSIADQQKPFPIPFRHTVGFDVEQSDVFPILQQMDPVREGGFDLNEAFTERHDALFAQMAEIAFGENVAERRPDRTSMRKRMRRSAKSGPIVDLCYPGIATGSR